MKAALHNNKDFFAGMFFAVIGLAAAGVALRYYPIGTARNMGPGYLPMLMGGILAAFGFYILLRGLIKGEKVAGVWGIRPLALVSLGIAAFGFCIERFGLIPSLVILLFIVSLGGEDFKLRHVLTLIPVLISIAWVVFIYGLGLPLRLFIWGG